MKLFFNGMGLAFLISGISVVFLTDTLQLEKWLMPFGMIGLVLPSIIKNGLKQKSTNKE